VRGLEQSGTHIHCHRNWVCSTSTGLGKRQLPKKRSRTAVIPEKVPFSWQFGTNGISVLTNREKLENSMLMPSSRSPHFPRARWVGPPASQPPTGLLRATQGSASPLFFSCLEKSGKAKSNPHGHACQTPSNSRTKNALEMQANPILAAASRQLEICAQCSAVFLFPSLISVRGKGLSENE